MFPGTTVSFINLFLLAQERQRHFRGLVGRGPGAPSLQ
jgi:hypothetical protein